MSLSRREIELVVDELSGALWSAAEHGPAAIQKIYEVDDRTFILRLRVPGHSHHLLVSTEPGLTRLHLVTDRPRQPDHPSAFTMQLRKWLQGALLDSIVARPADRIVDLSMRVVDPGWVPPEVTEHEHPDTAQEHKPQSTGPAPRVAMRLVLELTGGQANVFLLDAAGRILGQQHADGVRTRRLRPGASYAPPPAPARSDAGEKLRPGFADLDPRALERSQRLEADYARALEDRRRETLSTDLRARLNTQIRSTQRLLRNIERDLSRIENAERYRQWGELLQGAHGRVERGQTHARVPNYYEEGMPEVEVPLDPALSLQKNIERYFHQYRRYKNARERVEERMLETLERLDALEASRERLDDLMAAHAGEALHEALEALRDELAAKRLLPRRQQRASGTRQAERRALPYREFRARSGARILVGRGARHNDALTTGVARGRDIWLHARDWAGAHVVLRMDSEAPPRSDDLLDAAMLAAHFSRGRNDTVIDVTHTRAKYVRKPKGFPPGRVTVAAGSTLSVSIDPERIERLLESEVEPRP